MARHGTAPAVLDCYGHYRRRLMLTSMAFTARDIAGRCFFTAIVKYDAGMALQTDVDVFRFYRDRNHERYGGDGNCNYGTDSERGSRFFI